MNRICNTCNIEIDDDNSLKDRTVFKSCYIKNRGKNQQPKSDDKKKRKVDNSVNKTKVVASVNNNRTLIIGFSNCGKTYLMNHILHQKPEQFFLITKSLNQYPNIKSQTSDEIQPLNEYEKSVVIFDDMLLSKQESNIDLFYKRST